MLFLLHKKNNFTGVIRTLCCYFRATFSLALAEYNKNTQKKEFKKIEVKEDLNSLLLTPASSRLTALKEKCRLTVSGGLILSFMI